MSRAFVKETDFEQPPELPEPARPTHPNYITATGLAALRTALATTTDEREIRRLQMRIAAAVTVDPVQQPRDRVAFGATVRVADVDGRENAWRIVGEDEAHVERGWVSWTSPLAQALAGARVGDAVVWQRPAGELELEVLGIDYETA